MSLTPLLTADPAIQIHAAAGTLALVLGPVAIWRRRRDRMHKILGYTWVISMAVLALSSFAIPGGPLQIIGPFGALHGLAILVLVELWMAIRAARQGNIARHEGILRGLYTGGLLIAGALNFLPGRTLNRMAFDGDPQLGWVAIALLGTVALWLWLRPDLRLTRRSA